MFAGSLGLFIYREIPETYCTSSPWTWKERRENKDLFLLNRKILLARGRRSQDRSGRKIRVASLLPPSPLSLLFPPHFCRPKNEAAHYVLQHGSNFEHARCLGGGVSFFSGRSRSSDLFLAKQLLEGWMRPLAYILAVVTKARLEITHKICVGNPPLSCL